MRWLGLPGLLEASGGGSSWVRFLCGGDAWLRHPLQSHRSFCIDQQLARRRYSCIAVADAWPRCCGQELMVWPAVLLTCGDLLEKGCRCGGGRGSTVPVCVYVNVGMLVDVHKVAVWI